MHKKTLNYRVEHYGIRFALAFFLVGLFNNNGYVLLQAGASSLSKEFHQENYMPII